MMVTLYPERHSGEKNKVSPNKREIKLLNGSFFIVLCVDIGVGYSFFPLKLDILCIL